VELYEDEVATCKYLGLNTCSNEVVNYLCPASCKREGKAYKPKAYKKDQSKLLKLATGSTCKKAGGNSCSQHFFRAVCSKKCATRDTCISIKNKKKCKSNNKCKWFKEDKECDLDDPATKGN